MGQKRPLISWNLAGWSRWTQLHKTGPCPCHDLVQISLFTPKCAATTTFEPRKETHNKNISGNSPNIFRIKYGTQKKYKVLLCTTARQDLYVESSEVHNFDINRCDEEKQKKHIAANWVATPVTLTGHIGSLREHIYAALVGTEKWPTFVLVDMSLSLRCDLCNVCPCAMYFRLLFFNGSENAVITLA